MQVTPTYQITQWSDRKNLNFAILESPESFAANRTDLKNLIHIKYTKNIINILRAYLFILFWAHINDECVLYNVVITQAEVPSSHIDQWVTQAEAHGPATYSSRLTPTPDIYRLHTTVFTNRFITVSETFNGQCIFTESI